MLKQNKKVSTSAKKRSWRRLVLRFITIYLGIGVLNIFCYEFVGRRYRRSNRICMDGFVERQCDLVVLVGHLSSDHLAV